MRKRPNESRQDFSRRNRRAADTPRRWGLGDPAEETNPQPGWTADTIALSILWCQSRWPFTCI